MRSFQISQCIDENLPLIDLIPVSGHGSSE
jgi:hypothetical protein